MKRIKNVFALTLAMAMFTAQVQGQTEPCCPPTCCEDSNIAYCDGEQSCCMSAALIPLGALAVAAILIATTDRNHHSGSSSSDGSYHSRSSSSSGSSSSSSHSHFHSHF